MEAPSGPSGPPRPDADGNYDSPALQALNRVWDDYCQEIAGPDDVLDVIGEIAGFSQAQLQQLDQQVRDRVSNPENEAFKLIHEAFEILLEACEFMILEFAEELPDGVEEPDEGFFLYGFDLVQEATNQMMAGHLLGMEHIDAMAEVSCPFCSQLNQRGEPKCGRCGRALPTAVDTGQALDLKEHQGLDRSRPDQDAELTKNYAMAAHLLEGWKAGAVGAEQLGDFLDHLEQNFSGHLGDTDQQEKVIARAPESRRKGLLEALNLTRRGLQMSLDSVARMRLAFEKEDDRYLFFGLGDLEEASRVLVDAYWANKEASK
ncbi:MAG: hypothetical protein WC314_04475 [Vulcanimicrobiota bacterium]